MNILQINSSARGEASDSTRLAKRIVEKLLKTVPAASLTVHDLQRQPVPQLDESGLQALFTPAEQRSAEQAARVAQADAVIAELLAADVIVLAVPMYNFSAPVQVKNWVDALARAGTTFRYTASGPEGLIKGKKVFVATTRGGMHRDKPTDGVTPWLSNVLGFLGMTDVQFIYAEGMAMGEEAAQAAFSGAEQEIEALSV